MNQREGVSPQLLEATPEKALRFLRAIAIKAEIRMLMFAYGYTEEEQSYGWELLLLANGVVPEELPLANDRATRAAIAELDSWDEVGFRRMRAALGRLHPEQEAFVFQGVTSGQGAGAVVSVATVLDRLDLLEIGEGREATREGDLAALETLAARGIDAAERGRLRALVNSAQGAGLPRSVEVDERAIEKRDEALEALYAWYLDWSETARAVIRRRDHLVMLGLAKRRVRRTSSGRDEEISEVEEAPDTQPLAPGAGTGNAVAASG